MTTTDAEPTTTARTPPATSPAFIRLSDLLNDIPEAERYFIVKEFGDAVGRHGLRAVRVTDKTFTATYRDLQNKKRETTRDEELVVVDERLLAWVEQKRADAEKGLMVETGHISITEEEALANPARLLELAERRSLHHKKQGPGTERPEAGKKAGAGGKAAPKAGGKKRE